MSLAEATGYGSLEITYDGVNESDVYNEGSYYSMTAGSGNTFAVMKFTLKNPTGEDINVDMFGNARTYKATFPMERNTRLRAHSLHIPLILFREP